MGLMDLFKAKKNAQLKASLEQMQTLYESLRQEYVTLKENQPKEKTDFERLLAQSAALQKELEQKEQEKQTLEQQITTLQQEADTAQKKITDNNDALAKQMRDLRRAQELYHQFKEAVKGYEKSPDLPIPNVSVEEELLPMITLDVQCMKIKDLRAEYHYVQKEIQKVYQRYEGRYTTKANIAIYKLMVIAMEAELQNVMYTLSYKKLDESKAAILEMISKYYNIAVEGNQSIVSTMKSFIAEIELLFIKAVEIEYEYYVKKERAKEEQRALREKMQQEAEERKALETERKKIEKEEAKYENEMRQLAEKIEESTDDNKIAALREKIEQLQKQVLEVKDKKSQIIHLQNGKAGYVYVISNLGAFGEDVFKVGMTRRREPLERVKELGSASVPFEFDVHSLIFSEDAVALETALHHRLQENRVNKVNLHKEFFKLSVEDMEQVVLEYDPAAEFCRDMPAEQYHQSLNRDILEADTEEDWEEDEEEME